LLLGIIERMGVQKRPDELAADIFEAEFEMRMLVDRVVAAEESACTNVQTLLVGDFFGNDKARGIAGAGGGNGGIEGMREGVAKSDAQRSGLNEFAGVLRMEHARLSGHRGK
jgi:hypothetical protein